MKLNPGVDSASRFTESDGFSFSFMASVIHAHFIEVVIVNHVHTILLVLPVARKRIAVLVAPNERDRGHRKELCTANRALWVKFFVLSEASNVLREIFSGQFVPVHL